MPYRTADALYVTLFINDKADKEGWSESYWSRTTDYAQCIDKYTKVFWPIRRAMMASDVRCELIRVSKTTIKGDTRVARPADIFKTDPEVEIGKDQYPGDSTFGNVAMYYRCETANEKVHNVKPLHGIPTLEVPDKEAIRNWTPSAKWVSRFNKFRDFLLADVSLASRSVTPASLLIPGDTTGGSDIISMPGGTAGVAIGQLISGGGIPQFTKVIAVGGVSVVMSTRAIITIANNQLTFSSPPTPTVTVHPVTKVIMPFELRYRKLGRPFGQLRGRLRRRKSPIL